MVPLLNPVAISWGPLNVTWYGIILGTAALVGLLLAITEGKRFGIKSDFFMDLLLYGVPAAIIGARTYYVAFQWEDYRNNPAEIIAIWHGGIAIHGALIGAVLAAVIYTRVKKVSFWRIADICAPSLIVGQMIGRWGNFVNQEAHGGEVSRDFLDSTLHLPDWIVNQMLIDGSYYHPTFLYESIWNLAGLALLFWLRRRPFVRAGELFFTYLIWYSIGRFFIEGLRTDSLAFNGPEMIAYLLKLLWSPMSVLFEPGHLPEGGGNIRIAQLIGLLIIVAAVVLMIFRRRRGYADERYADPVVFGGRNDRGPGARNGQDSNNGGSGGDHGGGGVMHGSGKDIDDDVAGRWDNVNKSEASGDNRWDNVNKSEASGDIKSAGNNNDSGNRDKPQSQNPLNDGKAPDPAHAENEEFEFQERIQPGNPLL